ncbi:hypothetical protein FNV43_RR18260 [Rhamnella rubrinervis]|uniref:peptidylprolyl isomerase n=1 Tax=Rhamnella rubrinervis TaxID=2594499 RepID=A0A8K0DYP8_9ROSA|nr:hypothetical protein FNV43_RR18260 [Rhamnella rubrinervis]
MAFWGIEVKPGKPFTHIFEDVRGRLHISMATLGFGNATSKSLLQCNVGNRSPVYLCSLYPEKSESLQLNLEFEEVDEVIFSVIGPRSIHLSGYYLDRVRNSGVNFDSESYGEDIADTDTQRSCDSDEDMYEDSFIDDGDQEMLSFSPVYSGGEEIMDNKKKGDRRRLRKKYQLVESDPKTIANDGSCVPVSKMEDEDTFPISPLYKSKTTAKAATQEAEENVDKANGETSYKKTDNKKPKNGKSSHRQLRKKFQLVESDDEGSQSKTVANNSFGVPGSEREDEDTLLISSLYKSKTTAKNGTQEAQENVDKGTGETSYEKTEDRGKHDTESKRNVDIIVDGQPKRPSDLPVDLLISYSEVGHENGGTPKKKRKERSAKGKPSEIDTDKTQQYDIKGHDLTVEDGKEQKVVNNNSGAEMLNNFLLPATKVEPQSDQRSKTKRKELGKEGKSFEIDSAHNRNVVKENKAQQDETKADMVDQELHIRSEQNQVSANDQSFDHISCGFADGNLSEDTNLKKKKKKRSKTQENIEAVNMDSPSSLFGEKNSCIGMESKNTNIKTPQVRTLPSGLVIEELEMGKPDGKVAASGKKLTVYYVGKLKNGEVVDSNVGGDPYKFRLGKGAVIEGWDAGLDGMRVGEKRRLTIPPSMGFQSEGDGKNIPPDSWLVYEVELVKVR